MNDEKNTIIQQIDEIEKGLRKIKAENDERFTIKQMEKTKKSLETRLAKLYDQTRKDQVVNFEELGIDRLFVDESHNYKNLLFVYQNAQCGRYPADRSPEVLRHVCKMPIYG